MRASASARERRRRERRRCGTTTRAWTTVAATVAVTTAAAVTTARAQGGGNGAATCAVESDGLTWCAYGNLVSGLDVAYAPVASGATTVNHWIRATFSGTLNPGTNGWASVGPGTSMSDGKVVVGGGVTATTKFTLTGESTPTNACATNCPISAESVTSNATATTIKFKLVDANSPVGTVSCVWAMHGSPWPNQHSSKGTVSFSLTGEGVSSSVSGSKLNRDVTHGVLMVIAWVIFMPFGSASTNWKRLLPERWFYVHVSLVGAGSVLFAIALCLLIGRDDRAKDSKVDTHYSLAIAVISLWLIQLSLGALRPNKKPEDGARLGCIPAALRPAWFWAHRLIAPTVLAVAAATIFVGADLMHDRYGTRDSTGVSFLRPGVLGGVYAAVAVAAAAVSFVPTKPRVESTNDLELA